MEYIKVRVTIEPYNEIAGELLIAEMGDLGYDSFCESDTGFDAYIPSKNYVKADLNSIQAPFEGLKLSFSDEVIPDQNWNKKWEENYFQPIVIGNEVIVRSPFHATQPEIEKEIIIDPKMSFGTGHHSTTSLMMQYILETDVKDKYILDMGCGTGLLGMLASLQGAKSIDGIDIDEWAYTNSIENLELNHIKNMKIFMGGAELLVDQQYDIILANINRNILLNDICNYAKVLKPNGSIFFSGFYTEDLEAIKNEAQKYNLEYQEHKIDKNWVATKFYKAN